VFSNMLKQLVEKMKPNWATGGFDGCGLYPVDRSKAKRRTVKDVQDLLTDPYPIVLTPKTKGRRSITEAFQESMRPKPSKETRAALEKKKKPRKRVQHETGECLTSETAAARLQDEAEQANNKKKKSNVRKRKELVSGIPTDQDKSVLLNEAEVSNQLSNKVEVSNDHSNQAGSAQKKNSKTKRRRKLVLLSLISQDKNNYSNQKAGEKENSLASPILSQCDEVDGCLLDVQEHRKHERAKFWRETSNRSDKNMEHIMKTLKMGSQDPLEVDWEEEMFLEDNNYLFEDYVDLRPLLSKK
jgi:hypothetical protein